MYEPWKPKSMFTRSDWAVYHAAYEDASRRRSERGEVGSHIGNDFEAKAFVYRVNPPRFEHLGGPSTYVHPAERARQRVEHQFARLVPVGVEDLV